MWMTPEMAPPLQTTTPRLERTLRSNRLNVHHPLLHDRSSVTPGLEPATRWLLVRDHNYCAVTMPKGFFFRKDLLYNKIEHSSAMLNKLNDLGDRFGEFFPCMLNLVTKLYCPKTNPEESRIIIRGGIFSSSLKILLSM
ncbi:hypothetical protein TNCV_4623581 [Trichonephila clavipes]|nr:hypothetical protein TNCV_4623581 [Trichonephila clavipes]